MLASSAIIILASFMYYLLYCLCLNRYTHGLMGEMLQPELSLLIWSIKQFKGLILDWQLAVVVRIGTHLPICLRCGRGPRSCLQIAFFSWWASCLQMAVTTICDFNLLSTNLIGVAQLVTHTKIADERINI